MTPPPLRLTVHVGGASIRAARTASVARHLAARIVGDAHVEVVDVIAEPQRAEESDLIATPTIVVAEPAPARRVVGVPESPSSWRWR